MHKLKRDTLTVNRVPEVNTLLTQAIGGDAADDQTGL